MNGAVSFAALELLNRKARSSVDPTLTGSSTPPVPGYAAWWDANNAATRFQNSNGTTPATSDGDPVGYLGDLSVSVRNLLQATSTKRLTLKLNIKNGRSVLRGDGVDDYLRAVFTLNQPYTIFTVMLNRSPQDGGHVMRDGGTADTAYMFWHGVNTPRIYGGTYLNSGTYTGTDWHIWRGTYAGASSKINLDGGAVTTGDAGALNAGGITIGAGALGSYACDMDFGEAVVYPSSVSDSDAAAIFSWLNSRWAVY